MSTRTRWTVRRVRRWLASAALAIQLVIVLIGFPAAYILTRWNVEPSFIASATTERVVFRVRTVHPLRWQLAGVRLYSDGAPTEHITTPFDGTIAAADGAMLTVERIAQGPLVATLKVDSGSAAQLQSASHDSVIPLGSLVSIEWGDVAERAQRGESITLALDGKVILERLGTPVIERDHPIGMLRSGTVTLLKRSPGLLGGDINEIGVAKLGPGDELKLVPATPVTGFISADERAALVVSLRAVAREALLTPSGGQTHSITATFLDHIRSDKAVQDCWLWLLFFFGATQIVGKLRPSRTR